MSRRMCLRSARRWVFAIALVLGLAYASAAQLPETPAVAALTAAADRHRLALRFDAANAAADEAIDLANRTGDRAGLARANLVKGLILFSSGRSQHALPWLERALLEAEAMRDRRAIARAASALSAAAAELGDSARARALAARDLEIQTELGDEHGRAVALLETFKAEDAGRVDDPRLIEAYETGRRLGAHDVTAYALRLRGSTEFRAGDLAAAERTLKDCVAAYDRTDDLAGSAAARLELGRVYRAHGDAAGALGYYRQAVELLAPTGERYTLVEAVNATGVALAALGRSAEATAAYERGLALARESGNPRLIDFMLGNLGGGLVKSGSYARAIPVLEEVLARKPDPYIAAFRHAQLAIALGEVGRTSEGLVHATESVRLTRAANRIEGLDNRLLTRAWLLSALGRQQEALDDLRDARVIIEQVRARLVPVDFLKQGYGDLVQQVYARSIDALTLMGRHGEAVEAAEEGRARAFLDLLAARESTLAAAEPPMPGEGAVLGTRGGAAPEHRGRPGRPALRSESLARALTSADIAGVASRLGSTLVEYWVADKVTTIWVIGADGRQRSARVAITRERLTALVASTKVLPQSQAAAAGLSLSALSRDNRAAWRELHRLLIEPIRDALPGRGGRLTIIPHGPLFLLSFAALVGEDGRYLLERFELHYAPSASVLEFTGRRQQGVAGAAGPWLLVGNPAALPLVDGKALAPLPGAARELAAIAAIAPAGRVVRLEGPRASEAELERALGADGPSVLHFSTHGFVFDDPAKPPFLALNRTGPGPASDGRLTTDEVYALSLATDLVVLGACRTGLGQISADGVQGLSRAFFYAGTPSVAATFWDVADETMAQMMTRFYRSYARTRQKSASLRTAQLALLADLRAGRVRITVSGRQVTLPEHPLLWAGMFLAGEP